MELSDLFLDHGRIAEGEPLSVFDTVLANTVGVKGRKFYVNLNVSNNRLAYVCMPS